MATAHTKIVLGRIRSKYKQSNALWTLDGDQLLQEGLTELTALRETLEANSTIFFPEDFSFVGSARMISTSLIRLCNEKVIIRLGQGIYCYPKVDKSGA